MGPAGFKSARPQPDLITEQLRDPPLADPVKNKQRVIADAPHQCVTMPFGDFDLPEPSAPTRRLIVGARQVGGHRVTPAGLGQARLESLLEDPSRGSAGQTFA